MNRADILWDKLFEIPHSIDKEDFINRLAQLIRNDPFNSEEEIASATGFATFINPSSNIVDNSSFVKLASLHPNPFYMRGSKPVARIGEFGGNLFKVSEMSGFRKISERPVLKDCEYDIRPSNRYLQDVISKLKYIVVVDIKIPNQSQIAIGITYNNEQFTDNIDYDRSLVNLINKILQRYDKDCPSRVAYG